MPASFIDAGVLGTANTSAATVAASVVGALTTDVIAGVVTWGSGTTTDLASISDNGTGGTWVILRSIADGTHGQSAASIYGYGWSVAPTTVTANFSPNQQYRGISIEVFRGLVTGDPLDGTNEAGQLEDTPGTGTDGCNSGTSKTPSGDGYVIYCGSVNTGDINGTGASEFTAGTNFTEPADTEWITANHISLSSEYWIQGSSTAVDAAFTASVAQAHITFMIVFAIPAPPVQTGGLEDNIIFQAPIRAGGGVVPPIDSPGKLFRPGPGGPGLSRLRGTRPPVDKTTQPVTHATTTPEPIPHTAIINLTAQMLPTRPKIEIISY